MRFEKAQLTVRLAMKIRFQTAQLNAISALDALLPPEDRVAMSFIRSLFSSGSSSLCLFQQKHTRTSSNR
jgi:hypothetical protein